MASTRLGVYVLSLLALIGAVGLALYLLSPVPDKIFGTLEIEPDAPQPIPTEDDLLQDPNLSIVFARCYSLSYYGVLRIDAAGACNFTCETGDMYRGKKIEPGWKRVSIAFGKEKLRRLVALLYSSGYFQLDKSYFLRGVTGGKDFFIIVKGSQFRKTVHCTYTFPAPMEKLEAFFDEQVFSRVDLSQGEPCAQDPLWNGPDAP
jgi:hypothetical protein